MTFKHTVGALILLFALFSQSFAQQTPAAAPPQTDEQHKEQQEMRRKAIDLLNLTVKDSESFKLPENRIRIRMMAADVLWAYDEERARTLFKEASAGIVDILNDQEMVEQPVRNMMVESVKNLRREMLKILGGRDARLAREFLRATRSSPSEPTDASHVSPDNDLQLEVGLATQIAATDPKQALEIGRESLSRGFSPELINLLPTLQQKDATAAARLAGEIVTKLRGVKLDSNNEAQQVALSLLRIATQSPDEAKAGATPAPALLETPALRELTEMLAAEALRPSGDGSGLLGELQGMMSVVEKYAPARAAQLRRKTEKKEENVEVVAAPDPMQDWSKYQQLTEKGTVQEILDAAAKAPEGMREMLYLEAARKAMKEGNAETARSLINENVKDPQQRQMLLEQLDQAAAIEAAEQGKIEQTRKMLATLRTNEERVMLLAQLAAGAAAKGEKKAALQLLEEARGMMGAKAKNIKQLGAQLMVAKGYATLEPTRSLEILEPVVDQVNELLGAAIILGGFFTDEFIRDDEVMLEPIAMVTTEFFNQYVGDIQALASADFERTKALANKFQRDEIRIMVQLVISQSILSPQNPAAGRHLIFFK